MNSRSEILVVEDSPTQAERLRQLLERSGYAVTVAGNGEEALAELAERTPALVITDIVMPGMDGYALCEQIKSDVRLKDVPVILLTTLSEPEDVVKSLACGADNFVRKPYDDRYLLMRIGNILTSRELSQDGRMGVEVYLGGGRHFITAERQQILDFLLSTYEDAVQINEELQLRAAEVEAKNAELEARQAKLEQALRELDAERSHVHELANVNRAVLDATTDGILLVDPAGNRLLRNAALLQIGAKLPVELGDASISETVDALAPLTSDPDGLRAFVASLQADPAGEGQLDLELPEVPLSLRLFAARVHDGCGSLLGCLFVVRDITREREVERLKSELVATVSHELRTPLTSVLGLAELLLARQLDEPTRTRYVEVIAAEARRLAELVTNFLDLQRIEEGDFELTRPEPFDLREVVAGQVEVFAGQSAAHELVVDLPSTPLPVLGERDRITQVLANLFSNAIKYSPDGGPVELTVGLEDGFAEVAVRDRGLGIPAGQQDKIFTKFFRVDSSDTRSIGGTGLGLALAREIVETHGGRMGFRSTEREGSVFWFRLPLSRATSDARMADSEARA